MIATLDNAATPTVSGTLTDTLETLFAGLDLRSAGTGTDLVIDELDRWQNPKNAIAGFSTQTFNLVVVQGR